MSYASRSGRARTDPENPEAFGVCDRSGFWVNHADLQFQHEWRGNSLVNIRILVRPESYDAPFEHFRPIIVPPDPEPVWNPRPEFFAASEGAPAPETPVRDLVPLDRD